MAITVKINNVDRTEYVDARSLSIRDELTSKVNTASFDFICNDVAVAPVAGQTVRIQEVLKKLFLGRILSKQESFFPPNQIRYSVECIDYTRDLDKRLVFESYVNCKAGDIIKDIIAKYTPAFEFNTINVTDGPVIGRIAFDYVQVSDAITKIAETCGYEWYCNYEKSIYFFARNAYPTPFQLDDNQTDYKDLIIDTDISQIRNRVYVKSSAIKDTFGEAFIGDGVTRSWICKFASFGKGREASYAKPGPWNGVWNTSFSYDDIYLAIAYEKVYSYDRGIYIYKLNEEDEIFERINFPNVVPENDGHDVSFSPDSVYLALAHSGTPYVMIYKRDGDIFTKLSNPDILPTGNGWSCDFSSDGIYLAIAHETTPYITIYKRSEDTFVKLDNPVGGLPTGDAYGCKFSPDGVYLAVAHTTTPFITIYKRAGDVFTKLTNPADLPAGSSHSIAWTPDSVYLAIAHDVTPFITVYEREGDVFTKIADPDTLPTGNCWGVDFSPDGIHLAVAHTTTPYVTIYTHTEDTLTKQIDPDTLPTGNAYGSRFSHNNKYLAIGYFDSRNMVIYKQFFPTMKVDGIIKTIGWEGIDNPAHYDFMLNAITKVLLSDPCQPPPDIGVELLIGYPTFGKSICFRRDDKDSIADRIEKEGGDGIIEYCIVDNNINSLEWANEATKADLLQNSNPTIETTFLTNRDDIRSGQIITLNSIKRNINQQFIVQKVELIRVDTGEESIAYTYQVTIANKFKKLEDLFLYLLSKSDASLAGGGAAAPSGGVVGDGGATTFLGLTDTPGDYTGKAGEILRVNATPNAMEFSGVKIETALTVDSNAKVPTSKAVNDFCEITKNYMQNLKEDVTPELGGDLDLNDHNIYIYATLGADHTYSGLTITHNAGESVAFGDLLYFNWATKRWKKADADTASTMPGLLIALESKTDGQPCKMLVMGEIRDDTWNFTGAMVYASVTPGAMSSTAPIGAGDQVQRVGMAETADILFFDPSIDVGEI